MASKIVCCLALKSPLACILHVFTCVCTGTSTCTCTGACIGSDALTGACKCMQTLHICSQHTGAATQKKFTQYTYSRAHNYVPPALQPVAQMDPAPSFFSVTWCSQHDNTAGLRTHRRGCPPRHFPSLQVTHFTDLA